MSVGFVYVTVDYAGDIWIYAIRSNEITVTSLLKLMNIRTPEMIKCLFILYYFYIKYKTKYNKPKYKREKTVKGVPPWFLNYTS